MQAQAALMKLNTEGLSALETGVRDRGGQAGYV